MASTIMSVLDGQLADTLDEQLSAGQLDAAQRTLTENAALLQANCSDAVATIMRHLTDDNFAERPDTFMACERLLAHVAETVGVEDALFEFLEVIETTRSDNVFTSMLKSLQICMQRHPTHRVRHLEWCLNSILGYVGAFPLTARVSDNTDGDTAEQLFEDDDRVRRIVANYLTLFLFYEPVMQTALAQRTAEPQPPAEPFRSVRLTRSNVFVSFLLQLLGAPFYFLNLQRPPADVSTPTGDGRTKAAISTNTYSWQCASTIVSHILQNLPDPFVLLAHVERRLRWPQRHDAAPTEPANDLPDIGQPLNVFASEEKTPTVCIGNLFYLLYVERLMPFNAPLVYTHLYRLEGILYLLTEMLRTNVHAVHTKALRLADAALKRHINAATNESIPVDSLGLRVHEHFCTQLCRVITQSPSRQNSQHGAQILRTYVMRFDAAGRLAVVSNLLRTVQHGGLLGHVATMYKDMVAEALRQHEVKALPAEYCGPAFRALLLRRICVLEAGAETDLFKSSDQLVTALNVLHFLALGDRSNRTGFWECVGELQSAFLEPLRRGIELTRSHYGLEVRRVQSGEDEREKTGKVEVSVEVSGTVQGPIDREAKLKMLRSALTTFDLMENLLASVESAVRGMPKV